MRIDWRRSAGRRRAVRSDTSTPFKDAKVVNDLAPEVLGDGVTESWVAADECVIYANRVIHDAMRIVVSKRPK